MDNVQSLVTGAVNIKNTGTVNASEVSNTVLSGFVNSILYVDVSTDGSISGTKDYFVNLDNGTGEGFGECIYRGETYSIKEEKDGPYMYDLYGSLAPLDAPESDVVSYRIVLRDSGGRLTPQAILEKASSESAIPSGDDVISWTNVFTLYKNRGNPKQIWSGRAILPSEYDSLVPFTLVTEQGVGGIIKKYMRVPKYSSVEYFGEYLEVKEATEDGWYSYESGGYNYELLEDNKSYFVYIKHTGDGKVEAHITPDPPNTGSIIAVRELCQTKDSKEAPVSSFTGIYSINAPGHLKWKGKPFEVGAVPKLNTQDPFGYDVRYIVWIPQNESVITPDGYIPTGTFGEGLEDATTDFGQGFYEIKGGKYGRIAICRTPSLDTGMTAYAFTTDTADGLPDGLTNIIATYNLFEIYSWHVSEPSKNWIASGCFSMIQSGAIIFNKESPGCFEPFLNSSSARSNEAKTYSLSNLYYNIGGKTYQMPSQDITISGGEFVALKVGTKGDSPEPSLVKYSSLSDLQAAQEDLGYFVRPIYKFDNKGAIECDCRKMISIDMVEF